VVLHKSLDHPFSSRNKIIDFALLQLLQSAGLSGGLKAEHSEPEIGGLKFNSFLKVN
jgi:hypothetical protein